MQELQELKDKVAIITGGGYGIGKQIALAYGRAGMRVVIAARTQGPLEETCAEVQAAGARAMWLKTDVSKEADCARMIGETVKAFGRVDGLVKNAGIAGPTKLTPDMTLAEWQEVLGIKITGRGLADGTEIRVRGNEVSGELVLLSSR